MSAAIRPVGPQEWPLLASRIIDHASRFHGGREVYSRKPDGGIESTCWRDIRTRAQGLAQGLAGLGAKPGDRVGVMAWNNARHLESWYGVPGAGCVLHSLNPRLFAEQLVYIVNHAGDRWIVLDADLAPVLEGIADRLESVEGFIIVEGAGGVPETSLSNAIGFEDLVNGGSPDFEWVEVEETAPCGLCYTSGTTGKPKGVLFSHRSNVLHAMAGLQPDVLGLSSRDRVMPVVPFFHANGWTTPFSAPMAGAGMLLPGRDLTPSSLHELASLGATISMAVPTVWLDFLAWLDANSEHVPSMKRVVIGGSACPAAVIERFERDYGVDVIHAWGMTENSPLGSLCTLKPEVMEMSPEDRMKVRERCGHPFFTIDMEVIDEQGNDVEWDGESTGTLRIRGPSVIGRYFGADENAVDGKGWFDTGDIASIDQNAYIRIADRAKDVIKSGGEWISSIDIENEAVGHPGVAEAAAVARPDERWGERPVLFVVKADGFDPSPDEILEWLRERMASWQVPDDVYFVDEIPHTATKKIAKNELRKMLEEKSA